MQFIGNFVTFLIIPTGATTGRRITINLNNDGEIKVYNSAGVLVDEIGGNDGRIIAYDSSGTRFVAMLDGQLLDGAVTAGVADTANAGQFYSLLTGSPNFGARTFVKSPMGGNAAIANRVVLNLASGAASTGLFNPQIILGDEAGTANADFNLSGTVIKTTVTGSKYQWQTPVLGANWALGSSTGVTFDDFQYRLDAEDNVVMSGVFNAVTATPAATVFQFPVGYRPTNSVRVIVATSNNVGAAIAGQSAMVIANTGLVNVSNNPAIIAGQSYYVDAFFPLHNIA